MKKTPVLMLAGLAVILSACGEPPPTKRFSANLNAECQPHDIIDKLRDTIDTRSFWEEQEYDFNIFLNRTRQNNETSRDLLNTAVQGRPEIRFRAAERANQHGLRGAERDAFIRENEEDLEAQIARIEYNIEAQEIEMEWAERCMARIRQELASL